MANTSSLYSGGGEPQQISSKISHRVLGYCLLSLRLFINTAIRIAIDTPPRKIVISSNSWFSKLNTTDVAPAGG